MIRIFRSLYLTNRLFYTLAGIAVLFATSFFIPLLFPVAQGLLIVLTAVIFVDLYLLFNSSLQIAATRNIQKILSLGDENKVAILVHNNYSQSLHFKLIDELPEQFQNRDFSFRFELKGKEKKEDQLPLASGYPWHLSVR